MVYSGNNKFWINSLANWSSHTAQFVEIQKLKSIAVFFPKITSFFFSLAFCCIAVSIFHNSNYICVLKLIFRIYIPSISTLILWADLKRNFLLTTLCINTDLTVFSMLSKGLLLLKFLVLLEKVASEIQKVLYRFSNAKCI